MIEFDEARNEIFTLFLQAWEANAAAIVGYVPQVEWQGNTSEAIPDSSKFWARVSKQTVMESQASLSNCVGEPGQLKYTASGLTFVQIFCPKSQTDCYEKGALLAKVAKNAFRGKTTPGKIWFRNVRINELDPEELYERFNVVAEYEYDELG